MKNKGLPLNFQQLVESPKKDQLPESPPIEVTVYQTKNYFPVSFYKPISYYIGPRYFKPEE